MVSKQQGVRLHKFLSECGIASRRQAERLITEGRVSVNGTVITKLGSSINPRSDKVAVDRRMVRPQEKGVMLINKPRNVVSTMFDPSGRPCLDRYITKKYSSYAPVGRLDFESTGLIIFTNDGELSEWLLHPRYELPRVYQVLVRGTVSESKLQRLREGVQLDDGIAYGEARVFETTRGETRIEVLVKEGRNRLVRRMFAALRHPVLELHRISHGPFKLGRLASGEKQHLTERHYMTLRRQTERLISKA